MNEITLKSDVGLLFVDGESDGHWDPLYSGLELPWGHGSPVHVNRRSFL